MKKAEAVRRSRAAYEAKYPDRYQAWHQAMADPQPCELCGGEARPWFGPHPSAELLGWRCYDCRRQPNG